MSINHFNPIRWPVRLKLIAGIVLVIALAGIGTWLAVPTRVNIDPVPWIGKSASNPVSVFAWPEDRMGIVLMGRGKMRGTEIYGYSWPIDPLQNPTVYGVKEIPPEFLGISTESLVFRWASGEQQPHIYREEGSCPMVLLETDGRQVVAALGADQLIHRRLTLGFERTWAHPARNDWRECRYVEDMPIELYECNPKPKLLDRNRLHGATPNDIICIELEVDSTFPYYLLTTDDYPISAIAASWVGSGEPFLANAQGWLVIPNPLIQGDTDGCRVVQPNN